MELQLTTTDQHKMDVYYHDGITSSVGSITNFVFNSIHSRTNSSEHLTDNSKLSNVTERDETEHDSNTLINKEKLGHRRVDEIGNVTYKRVMVDDLMRSLQIGLNYVIGKHHQPQRQVLVQDFQQVEYQDFPPEGSKSTPSHPYAGFRLKTYAQIAFRFFRNTFGVEPSSFISSLCGKDLRELPNPGASGSIFYITNDDKYIIKTVSKKEAQFLLTLLPGYYMNLTQNPFTMLPKFFGLYCYQSSNKNIRFVIMDNLVPTNVRLYEKFDLKGSIYKRKASDEEHKRDLPTLKDNDFKSLHPSGFILEPFFFDQLKQTIEDDVRVLSSFGIMDYSLLLAVHNISEEFRSHQISIISSNELTNEHNEQTSIVNTDMSIARISNLPTYGQYLRVIEFIRAQQETSITNPDCLIETSSIHTVIPDESPTTDESADVPVRVNSKSPVQQNSSTLTHFQSNAGLIGDEFWYNRQSLSRLAMAGVPAVNEKGDLLLLYVGIIDILQNYRLRKQLEHVFKSTLITREEISVCNPTHYGDRFVRFITRKVFRKGGSKANTMFSDSQSNADQITIHSSRILNPSSSYRSQMSDDDDRSSIVNPNNELPTIQS